MSIKAVAWALDQKTGSPVSKLVLIKLADNYNEGTSLCCPSMEHIAIHTELSKGAVLRHIQRLEKLHLIKVERQRIGSVNLPNRYSLAYRQNVASEGGSSCQPLGGSSCQPLGVVADEHSNQNLQPERREPEEETVVVGGYSSLNSQKGRAGKSRGGQEGREGREGKEASAEARGVVQLLCDATNRIPNTVPQPLKTLEKWARDLDAWRERGGFGWDVVHKTVERVTAPGEWWSDKGLTAPKLMEHWNKFQGEMAKPKGGKDGGRRSEPRGAAGAREFFEEFGERE